jgi:predicted metal-dependent HD superfamily phosphohydrolase
MTDHDERDAMAGRWAGWWRRVGADRVPAFAPVAAVYGEPRRHYHALAHIRECLDEFDGVRGLCDVPDAVEGALWFHDLVYDPRRRDNEERSALAAATVLGEARAPAHLVAAVPALVVATKHSGEPATQDERVITDVDLAILGRPVGEFDAYERAIRLEYGHVSDEAFAAGRAAVLRHFLDRPSIYSTPPFRRKYEEAARLNRRRSLEKLTTPRPS